jgi:hypothetical protein
MAVVGRTRPDGYWSAARHCLLSGAGSRTLTAVSEHGLGLLLVVAPLLRQISVCWCLKSWIQGTVGYAMSTVAAGATPVRGLMRILGSRSECPC